MCISFYTKKHMRRDSDHLYFPNVNYLVNNILVWAEQLFSLTKTIIPAVSWLGYQQASKGR